MSPWHSPTGRSLAHRWHRAAGHIRSQPPTDFELKGWVLGMVSEFLATGISTTSTGWGVCAPTTDTEPVASTELLPLTAEETLRDIAPRRRRASRCSRVFVWSMAMCRTRSPRPLSSLGSVQTR